MATFGGMAQGHPGCLLFSALQIQQRLMQNRASVVEVRVDTISRVKRFWCYEEMDQMVYRISVRR